MLNYKIQEDSIIFILKEEEEEEEEGGLNEEQTSSLERRNDLQFAILYNNNIYKQIRMNHIRKREKDIFREDWKD